MTASMEGCGRTSTRPLFATVAYAEAFGLGSIDVPEWQTALLTRSIPGTEGPFDALGCYPLTVFGPEVDLQAGRERLRAAGLVSVALVPDPIASPSPHVFSAVFEICRPFKTHYLIDRSAGPARFSATHRRWIRKASRECEVTPIQLRDSLGDSEQALSKHGRAPRHRWFGKIIRRDTLSLWRAGPKWRLSAPALRKKSSPWRFGCEVRRWSITISARPMRGATRPRQCMESSPPRTSILRHAKWCTWGGPPGSRLMKVTASLGSREALPIAK